jgi:hypothetical protein
MRWLPTLALSALFALSALSALAAAQSSRVTYLEDRYPTEQDVPAATGWLGCRVVDDLTGAPIAGAELQLVPEMQTPLPGRCAVTRRATSDADGFVRARIDDIAKQWSWLVLRAPGHGPATASHAPPGLVWRLARSHDVPVLVQDVFGRALPGAEIDFCGCCGQPDLAHAATDAHGMAILRGIDPHADCELYVRHPDVALGDGFVRWHPGDPPFVWHGLPAPAWSGTLLDEAGRPLASVVVGTHQRHRGPWTETAADGSFVLCGGDVNEELIAVLPNRRVYFTRPHAFPVTLRVPPDDGTRAQQGIVEPHDPAPLCPETIAIRVERPGPSSLRVLSAQHPPKYFAPAATSIDVPSTGPFAISLCMVEERERATDDARTYPFPSAAALQGAPLVLAPYPPTRVTCTAVDAAGAPVAVRARLAPCSDSIADALAELRAPDGALPFPRGEVELFARATGRCLLALFPEGEPRPRIVWLTLPPRGDDARIDVGAVPLAATPALSVCDEGGAPLRGDDVTVRFSRDGQFEAGSSVAGALDARGGWLGPDLRAGDAVIVQRRAQAGVAHLPFRTVLAGSGPWTVRLPANEVELEVTGPQGARVPFTVFVADQSVSGEGSLVLAELPAGPTAMFVAAPGHRAARVEIDVPQRGRRAAKVELPVR